ncbi:MAG: recombinase family protein [bacterium]|nr:recombinase family protein [bacterium]
MIQHDTGIYQAVGAADVVTCGRSSSDHQSPSSIDDQASECSGFAEHRAQPAPGRILRDEGVSVKDGMAPNFERLLDEVRAGSVKMILVDELSRISRIPEDILRVQRLLRYYRVQLWAVHENIEITDSNSDIHVMFAGHKNAAASRDGASGEGGRCPHAILEACAAIRCADRGGGHGHVRSLHRGGFHPSAGGGHRF